MAEQFLGRVYSVVEIHYVEIEKNFELFISDQKFFLYVIFFTTICSVDKLRRIMPIANKYFKIELWLHNEKK